MGSQPALSEVLRVRLADRNFYIYMSLACALTAFVGFSHTYFFRGFSGLPPLSTRAHLHGAVFTAWMLLFVAQTALVRTARRDLHRGLGVAGTVLAVLMVWAATVAALGVAARFQATGVLPHGLTPVAFLAIQLGMVLQFALLVLLAIRFRARKELHKRLMLLATVSILPPAIARLHLENYGFDGAYTSTLFAYGLVLVAAAYDFTKMRRVHAVYMWGGLGMLAWMFLRSAIGQTQAWQSIGLWLIT